MKKRLIVGYFFILLLSVNFVAAFAADEYSFTSDFNCADFGIECGTGYISGENIHKSCGICDADKYCYFGKCITISDFGPCERPEYLDTNCETAIPFSDFYNYPGQPLSQRLEQYKRACENYGCTYNSETKKCTGTLPSCSYFQERSCKTNDFEPGEREESPEGYKRSIFNEQTGICTTTMNNFPKENCNLFNGQWNEAEQACTYVEGLNCMARDDKWGSYYCRLRNIEDYTPSFTMYRDSSSPIIVPGGAYAIYLDNDDLNNIEKGETVRVNILLEKTGLPVNTPITISAIVNTEGSINNMQGNIIHIQQEPLSIDSEGKVSTKLEISKELLSLINYKGYSSIKVSVDSVNYMPMPSVFDIFSIITKKGDCAGTARACSDYSEAECLEIARFKLGTCSWNYDTSSCTGGQGVSCDTFGQKESCKVVGCTWTANNIFERILDWIKGIFGA